MGRCHIDLNEKLELLGRAFAYGEVDKLGDSLLTKSFQKNNHSLIDTILWRSPCLGQKDLHLHRNQLIPNLDKEL